MNIDDRIIVTGAAGLVGSSLVRLLKQEGYNNIIALTRRECDLRDINATNNFFINAQPSFVFHCAGKVYGIMGNMKNKALSFYDNILINTNVIEAAHQANVSKILVMGTGAVYPFPPPGLPLKEDMIFQGEPHSSEDSYAHAKRAMLAMLRSYNESYAMKWVYIVSCNLYGEHDRFDEEMGHVVPSLIKKFSDAKRQGKKVIVWGDGSAQRDFMYIEDAAKAIVLSMQQIDGVVNLGSSRVYKILDIVDGLTKISGMQGKILWDASKPNGQDYRAYNLDMLNSIGFECRFDLYTGLKRTWNWYEMLDKHTIE